MNGIVVSHPHLRNDVSERIRYTCDYLPCKSKVKLSGVGFYSTLRVTQPLMRYRFP